MTNPLSKRAERAIVLAFMTVLCLPFVALELHVDDERRALAFEMTSPPPTWPRTLSALKEWPNSYRRYFNAHFGFRAPLMRLNAELKIRLFRVSSSDKVVLGKEGWLFYAAGHIMEDYRGRLPFTDAERSAWVDMIERRGEWLQSRGIPYLFYFAPNGQTIYQEFMPDDIDRGTSSRLDQLTESMGTRKDVLFVDLRPALLAAKASDRLYFKTDTHWNPLGAFVAYQQLAPHLESLFPRWRRDSSEDYERVATDGWSGDLALMLATSLFHEVRVDLLARRNEVTGDASAASIERPVIILENERGEVGTAVVFRDSFFAAQAQFLARHFRRTVLISGTGFDPAVVERERPDVVIQEMVERTLVEPVPSDPLPAGPSELSEGSAYHL